MAGWTDDTTIDDEYEIQRLDSLPDDWRNLAGGHEIDQLEATDPYVERFRGFGGNDGLMTLSEANEQ